jgi:hypothetical protein
MIQWNTQPRSTPQIDWSNSLCDGLQFCLPLNGTRREIVKNKNQVALVGGVTPGSFATLYQDVSLRGNGGGGASIALDLSQTGAVIALGFSWYWDSYVSDRGLLMEFSANSNLNPGWYVFPDDSNTGQVIANFVLSGQGPSNYKFARPLQGVVHHTLLQFSGAATGKLFESYVDGRLVTSAPAFQVDTTHLGGNFGSDSLYLLSRNNASLQAFGNIWNVCIWNRMLSPGEATTWTKNPNILYAGYMDIIEDVVSGGTGSFRWRGGMAGGMQELTGGMAG